MAGYEHDDENEGEREMLIEDASSQNTGNKGTGEVIDGVELSNAQIISH